MPKITIEINVPDGSSCNDCYMCSEWDGHCHAFKEQVVFPVVLPDETYHTSKKCKACLDACKPESVTVKKSVFFANGKFFVIESPSKGSIRVIAQSGSNENN